MVKIEMARLVQSSLPSRFVLIGNQLHLVNWTCLIVTVTQLVRSSSLKFGCDW